MASKKKTLENAAALIKDQMENPGSCSRNIIGLILSNVAKIIDYDTADTLVDEYNLSTLFGIPKLGKIENDKFKNEKS